MDKIQYPLYELVRDYEDPNGTVAKGTRKTAEQWMARFALLNPNDCEVKKDWFLLVKEPFCSRCNKSIDADYWENKMCHGSINADISCQSTQALWKDDGHKIVYDHPALISQNQQQIKIEWGLQREYKLCWSCHKEFIGTIGDFLKSTI